ncbi:bifunctional helix-turn-helix transcriptional regulator/GNAT family N-acetyltransferase [Nocardiopsis mangrovi]|uniref:bifunctional helix-turn-helix transcriptional regulator/GNAT family N-acetyltransferase n=1 Tax=Nocardiopsis mangrovi TaxID=1179818 RepID=UPI0036725643
MSHAAEFRDFNRYYTQRIGLLTDRYMGADRPLSESRVLFEIGSGADVRDLRARLELDSGYLSRLLRSLEGQGLITVRAADGDRRIRTAALTPAGDAALADMNSRATDVADDLLSALDQPQQDRLIDAMAQVRRLLRLAGIDVAVAEATSAPARACLSAFADEMRARVPEGYDDGELVDADELTAPRGALLIATEHGRAVGCAALRRLDDDGVGEVRHMWVRSDARGIGLGHRLLREVELHAAAMGMHALRLGTNSALREALAMYRTRGYVEIPPYDGDIHVHHAFEKALRTG